MGNEKFDANNETRWVGGGVGTNAKVRRLVDSHEQHKLHVDDDRV